MEGKEKNLSFKIDWLLMQKDLNDKLKNYLKQIRKN
jgi:hypothetical protein